MYNKGIYLKLASAQVIQAKDPVDRLVWGHLFCMLEYMPTDEFETAMKRGMQYREMTADGRSGDQIIADEAEFGERMRDRILAFRKSITS